MKKIIMLLLSVCFAASAAGGWNPGACSKLNSLAISSIRHYEQNYRYSESKTDSSKVYICVDGLQYPFPYDSISNAYFFSLKNRPSKRVRHRLKKKFEAYFVRTWLEGDRFVVGLFLKSGRIDDREDLWTETDRMAYVHGYCEEDGKWRQWALNETKRNFDIPKENPLNLMVVSCIKKYREHYKRIIMNEVELAGNPEMAKKIYVRDDGLQEPFPYDSIENVFHFSCYNKITGKLGILLKKCVKKRHLGRGLQTYFVNMNFEEKDISVLLRVCYVYMETKRKCLKRETMINFGLSDWCEYTYRYSEMSGKWEFVKSEYGGI